MLHIVKVSVMTPLNNVLCVEHNVPEEYHQSKVELQKVTSVNKHHMANNKMKNCVLAF